MTVKEYLEYYHDYNNEDSQNKVKEYNRELCEKYPWLIPRNAWSGKRITDCANGEDGYWPKCPEEHPEYDHEYTELDQMPDGWRIAFGEQMCGEIHDELVKFNFVDEYQILQIKEKFSGLRWYTNGVPKDSKLYDIIDKYEELSYKTCIRCGEPAEFVTTGWICPYCKECAEELKRNGNRVVSIEEYYGSSK